MLYNMKLNSRRRKLEEEGDEEEGEREGDGDEYNQTTLCECMKMLWNPILLIYYLTDKNVRVLAQYCMFCT